LTIFSKSSSRPLDGRLYLLGDKSAAIARLDDLPPGGGAATFAAAWRLHELDGKPEGLAFRAEGRAIVALDRQNIQGARGLSSMAMPSGIKSFRFCKRGRRRHPHSMRRVARQTGVQ
jgi:hypothetical protein